jgi:hypothetical protein
MQILTRLFARFVVIAQFDGKTAKHYARNWKEAMDWMRCYPATDNVEVYERVGGRQAVVPVAARSIG